MLAPDVLEDEVERRQALLAVDQLPRAVVPALHHHRLQVVGRPVALPDVVEELSDLVLAPPVAALVGGDEEVAGDVTDRNGLKPSGIEGARHQDRTPWYVS